MRTPYQKWQQSARSVSTSLQAQKASRVQAVKLIADQPIHSHTQTHTFAHTHVNRGISFAAAAERGERRVDTRQSQVACQLAINMEFSPINISTRKKAPGTAL